MDLVNPVKNFIIENFLFGESDHLKKESSFIENGIIDSTGILELVSFLEEAYEINIEDEELLPENFDSLSGISRFLETKLSEKPE